MDVDRLCLQLSVSVVCVFVGGLMNTAQQTSTMQMLLATGQAYSGVRVARGEHISRRPGSIALVKLLHTPSKPLSRA